MTLNDEKKCILVILQKSSLLRFYKDHYNACVFLKKKLLFYLIDKTWFISNQAWKLNDTCVEGGCMLFVDRHSVHRSFIQRVENVNF